MSRDLTASLAAWLEAGGTRLGQLAIRAIAEGHELRHHEDTGREDLELFTRWEDARGLANVDDAGAFRPLKTAPNLRHGWRLVLGTLAEVRKALDYFLPAMLGVAESFARGELVAVPLRTMLDRQTGMYAVTKKITDEQARALVERFCAGCLKHRLWELTTPSSATVPVGSGEFLLLCHEACNLLVAEARKVVKGEKGN